VTFVLLIGHSRNPHANEQIERLKRIEAALEDLRKK
jgi:hypothetical protein